VQLVCRGLELRGEARPLGQEQQHRRFQVTDGETSATAVWWNCHPELTLPRKFDLAFAPELNEFNGTYGIQLKVLDLDEIS
jgi:hypothetical protein